MASRDLTAGAGRATAPRGRSALGARSATAASLAVLIGVFLALYVSRADKYLAVTGALPLRPTFLFLAFGGACLALLFVWLRGQRALSLPKAVIGGNSGAIVPLALLALAGWAWSMGAEAYWRSGGYFILLPSFNLFALLVALSLTTFRPFRRHWRYFLAVPWLISTASILIDAGVAGGGRAVGMTGNATLSAFIAALLPACLVQYRRINVVDVLIIGTSGLAVYLTLSRGGMLAFAAFLMLYLLSLRITLDVRSIALVGVCVAVGLAGIVYGATHILGRAQLSDARVQMFTLERLADDGSFEIRSDLVVQAVDRIKYAPLLGYGTGATRWETPGPHNVYLMLWIEHGVAGIVLYAWFLIAGYQIFSRRSFLPGQGMIVVAAVYSLFVHTNLEERYFFLLYGILLGVSWFQARRSKLYPARGGDRARRERRDTHTSRARGSASAASEAESAPDLPNPRIDERPRGAEHRSRRARGAPFSLRRSRRSE